MTLREATIADSHILFHWRNDPLTRAMSVNTEPVAWETHVEWLNRRFAQTAPGLYICESDGIPLGMVRIDGEEISYTVGAKFRGKGLATNMLELAQQRFGPKHARVKRGNEASATAAARAGHIVDYIED